MKKIILFTAILLLTGGSMLYAQVRVQVNGDQSFVINETNGLYFHNDTMTVADPVSGQTYTFALDDITVITLQSTLGITQPSTSDLQFSTHPNPAQNHIVLQGIGSTPQKAVLYSTAGVKLLEQTVTDGSVINISHLPEGTYILCTINPNSQSGYRVAKIVKQL